MERSAYNTGRHDAPARVTRERVCRSEVKHSAGEEIALFTDAYRPVRLLLYSVLICFEATLIHLLATLLTSPGPEPVLRWHTLVVVVAAAATVTLWLEPLRHGWTRISLVTAVVALVTVAWATQAQSSDAGMGWGALRQLLDWRSQRFFETYVALAISLWAWRRGAELVDAGHAEVVQRLGRGVVALAVVISCLAFVGIDVGWRTAAGGPGITIAAEIMLFLLAGLLSLSLTRIVAVEGEGAQVAHWPWLRTSIMSSVSLVFLGLVLLAAFAAPASALLRAGVIAVAYAVATLLAPVAWLIFALMELVRDALRTQDLEALPPPTATAAVDAGPPLAPLEIPDAVVNISAITILLIPLLILVLAIVFVRRRRSRAAPDVEEQRESIFTWSSFGADISRMLRGLPRLARHGGGLKVALRRLRGGVPAIRIRRRYVQLLMIAETAGRQRRPQETPREFKPGLRSVPLDDEALTMLTERYEQARYAPETVDEQALAQAEAAWKTLTQRQQDSQGDRLGNDPST